MVYTKDIEKFLYSLAPLELACEWDNTGALVNASSPVKNVLCALDITKQVVLEAAEKNCNVIVSHHPVIFSGIKRINSDDVLYLLVKNDISAVCMHTNLDAAQGGVNDVLAKMLGIKNVKSFAEEVGRIGELENEQSATEFLKLCRKLFGTCFASRASGNIKKVAVMGGAGSDYMHEAFSLGADAYITGEVKHNFALDANHLGKLIVQAGHYETEKPVVKELVAILKNEFKGLNITESEKEQNPMFTVL